MLGEVARCAESPVAPAVQRALIYLKLPLMRYLNPKTRGVLLRSLPKKSPVYQHVSPLEGAHLMYYEPFSLNDRTLVPHVPLTLCTVCPSLLFSSSFSWRCTELKKRVQRRYDLKTYLTTLLLKQFAWIIRVNLVNFLSNFLGIYFCARKPWTCTRKLHWIFMNQLTLFLLAVTRHPFFN